ncbi:APC family permease [Amycolatopsis sp. GM8]|uniref:APC family permease n=1 Tax=Amycolatopsis sp. GM8 TaxID=2896530 RepID=UPI001F2EB2BE|nr:APC family permease [Amycolatopsis sp. GM8]
MVQRESRKDQQRGRKGQQRGLQRNLSVWAALGLSVALLGPSMAVNINPQAPAGKVGPAVPLVFVLSMVGVLLVAHAFARLSQHIANAGSVYGFIGATIGPRSGFVGGWLLLGTYVAFAMCTASGAALFFGDFLKTALNFDIRWEFVIIPVLLVVGFLALRPARAATKVLLVVEFVTIGLILTVAIVVFAKVIGGSGPASGAHVSALFTLPDGVGGSALFAAMIFGFLSFAGFEAASTLGEETRNPKRDIPVAIVGTVIVAGIFFAVVTSAEVLGFGTGPDGTAAFTASPSLVGDLASRYLGGPVGDLVTLGAAFSAFGSSIACTVGASRLLFAMGRDGFITEKLGSADKSGVPRVAVGSILAVVVLALVAMRLFATSAVVDVFFWTATIGALLLLVAYLLCLAGASAFIGRRRSGSISRAEIAIPIAGIAVVGYVLYRNVWPVPDPPYNTFPYLVAAWLAIGVALVVATPGLAQRIGARLSAER